MAGGHHTPQNQVSRLRANLLPLAALVRQPFHAGLGEAIPFPGPTVPHSRSAIDIDHPKSAVRTHHAQILSGSSLNTLWNSSLSLWPPLHTINPPSSGPFGRKLTNPCMHLKPGISGS